MAMIDKREPIFEMLIGVAGAGKSTYALNRKQEYNDIIGEACEIVSSDAIRGELWGDESDQREPNKVFEIMLARTRDYLSRGISVIYDACNFSEKYRKHTLRQIANITCHRIATVFIEQPEVCIARQALRDRKVPPCVIWRQIKQFQVPHKSEGWDSIDYYCHPFDDKTFEEVMELIKDFDQKNPHHTRRLDEHMIASAWYAESHKFDESVVRAVSLHDFGKVYTQEFDEKGVAHYYGHENVSAYFYFLLTGDTWWDGQQVAWLINHHMDFFKGEKYIAKLKNQINDDALFKLLEEVHECDINAH